MKTLIHDIHLAYTDEGQGTPLVFLHAFPLSKLMWHPQIQALRDSYRIITLDFRGHGESDALLWNFTLDDYANDVIGLLDHLNISQSIFIGLSMGGYVLFSLYRNFPNRVKAMVLADTRAQEDSQESKTTRRLMAQHAYKEGTSALAEIMLPKLLTSLTIQQRPDVVDQVRAMILEAPVPGIIVDLMAMAGRPDSTNLLSTISCPTLIVVGEEDLPTPPEESSYMAERIPGARFSTISQAGHLSNLEQPAGFNRILQSFLTHLDGPVKLQH